MITVFGSINLDLIFPLPKLPSQGQTVLGPTARILPGGKGANQAVAAARDGARVVMAGAVGRDALARDALAMLVESRVDISRVAEVEATTGCAAVCVDPAGRNQIAVAAGANLFARASQIEDEVLGPETTLIVQMECDPRETEAIILRARRRDARVILNLAPAAPLGTAALAAIDLLIANADEAAWLGEHIGSATNAASLHSALGVTVVVTHGVQGVEAYSRAGYHRVEVHKVDVRDTTGAGDCFTGVLAAALDRGMELPDAMQRANLAAALACTRLGAQASFPMREEIDPLLRRAPKPTQAQPKEPL